MMVGDQLGEMGGHHRQHRHVHRRSPEFAFEERVLCMAVRILTGLVTRF